MSGLSDAHPSLPSLPTTEQCLCVSLFSAHPTQTFMGVTSFRSDRRERPEEGGVGGVDCVEVLADPAFAGTDIT